MKKVLVTGGSGFVGRNVIKELLQRYPDVEITSFSRSEGSISQLMIDCPCEKRLKVVMADIRDAGAIKCAAKNKDTVIHLAAMKRVDLCEEQCQHAASTNVLGTMNVLNAFEGKTFVLMSTDKAVEPVNCYGATKLVAERMVIEESRKVEDNRRFIIIRSGNILGSTGSVLEIWKKQIEDRNEITVTHPDMLRYYTSVEGVVRLFVAVLEHGENGKLYFTPRGEAVILKELLDKALKLYGNDNTKIKYIGLRPGERMAEKMRTQDEKNTIAGFEEHIQVSSNVSS